MAKFQFLKIERYRYNEETRTRELIEGEEFEFQYANYQPDFVTDATEFKMINGDIRRIVRRCNIVNLNCTAIMYVADYERFLNVSNVDIGEELKLYYNFNGDKSMWVNIADVTTAKHHIDGIADLYAVNFTAIECER